MRPTQINRQPSNGGLDKPAMWRWQRPPTRLAVWWVIGFAISLAAALAGGGVVLWTVYRDSRSPGAMSLGATLLVFGFAAAIACLGGWLASGGHRRPGSEP